MKKTTLLGSALAVALSSAPVIAEDFHALSVLQATPAPMQDSELATTEGGAFCNSAGGSTAGNGNTGGVCLSADVGGTIGGNFAVANDIAVGVAQFLQVAGP